MQPVVALVAGDRDGFGAGTFYAVQDGGGIGRPRLPLWYVVQSQLLKPEPPKFEAEDAKSNESWVLWWVNGATIENENLSATWPSISGEMYQQKRAQGLLSFETCRSNLWEWMACGHSTWRKKGEISFLTMIWKLMINQILLWTIELTILTMINQIPQTKPVSTFSLDFNNAYLCLMPSCLWMGSFAGHEASRQIAAGLHWLCAASPVGAVADAGVPSMGVHPQCGMAGEQSQGSAGD